MSLYTLAAGGLKGLDIVVWDVAVVTDSTLVLSYLHEDGAEGMPGNLKIVMTYALTSDNEFKVDYVADVLVLLYVDYRLNVFVIFPSSFTV